MAVIGQALTAPESGWRRYDSSDPRVTRNGTWSNISTASYYNSTSVYTDVANSYLRFKFKGNQLRIFGAYASDRTKKVEVDVDGVLYSFSAHSVSTVFQGLMFEVVGLENTEHTVTITNKPTDATVRLDIDAIDIDSSGDLLGTGVQLTSPETGWRRYDDNDSRIIYTGTWLVDTNASHNQGASKYSTTINDSIKFKAYCSKIRLIIATNSNRTNTNHIDILVNGISVGKINTYSASLLTKIVAFEYNMGSTNNCSVEMINISPDGKYITLDAIDIDDTGYLTHPILNQVSDINNMQTGDCIPCRYTSTTSGTAGSFSELGSCIANEIPVTASATPNGLFYFIKVKSGLLIADRVVQHSVSWDILNTSGHIEGKYSVNVVPIMSSATGLEGDVISSHSSYTGGYYDWMGFDRVVDNAKKFVGGASTNVYLGFKFNTPKTVRGYTITARDGSYSVTQSPKDFKFQGSTDGVTWVDLDVRSNITGWSEFRKNSYWFNNNTQYSYYRLFIIANNGDPNATSFAELEMFEAQYLIRSIYGGAAYADENGQMSLSDRNRGSWPIDNEWDKFIVNSDLKGKITPGDDNIWHWNIATGSWMRDSTALGMRHSNGTSATNTHRTFRGWNTGVNATFFGATTEIGSWAGFRPALRYIDTDLKWSNKPTTLFY